MLFLKYKQNTDSCDSYLHVIMTLRPTASHSCPLLANVKPLPWNWDIIIYQDYKEPYLALIIACLIERFRSLYVNLVKSTSIWLKVTGLN